MLQTCFNAAPSRRARAMLGASVLALAAAASVPVQAQTLPTEGKFQKVAGLSIFTRCTADHVALQPGTNFPDTVIEPNLAINPTNPNNMLVGIQQDRWSNGGSRGLRGAYTLNGGTVWHPSSTPNVTKCQGGPWNRASDPWIAFSPDGTAYLSALVVDELPNPNKFGLNGQTVSRSTDGGVTWGPPTTLIVDQPHPLKKPQRLNDKNSITADVNDSHYVYTVWDRLSSFTPGFGEVDVAVPPGGGDGLSIARELRRRALSGATAAAAKAAGYPVFVTGDTWFSRTTDGGNTWEASKVIYNPGNNYQTIANQIISIPGGPIEDFFTRQNDLTGADQIGFVASTDQGATWSAATLPLDLVNSPAVTPNLQQAIRSADILFSVTYDAFYGLTWLTWQDTRFTGDNEVAVAWSPDGQQWTAPFRVNQTPRNPGNPLFQQALIPTVNTTADGTAIVTYYDFRNDTVGAGTDLTDAWAVFCNPGVATDACQSNGDWATELRLTDTSFDLDLAPFAEGHFLGDYMGMKSTGQTVFPVFGVATVPNQTALYTRKITVPASSIGAAAGRKSIIAALGH